MAQLRFLIIDDNPADRELAARTLRREFPDAELTPIATSEEFARALAQWEFDLVITDYQLRWTDGVVLLAAIKARYPQVPVIMFTASGSQEVAVEAMKQGLDDYVLKSPRHVDRLALAARAALDRAEQRRLFAALEAERRQLLAETQAAERRARFLADASARLAGSLDYRATLNELAQLMTIDLADWCFIDVPGQDGRIHRLALAHRDPAQAGLARELERLPPAPESPGDQAGAVIRTGETLFIPRVPPALVTAATANPQEQELLLQLRIQSVIVVALRARGQILGAISLVSSDPDRPFTDEDRTLAEDLAGRAALTIDNARLYTAEQRLRRRTEQLQAITAALVETATVADVARVLVEQGMASVSASSAAYLTLNGDTIVPSYSAGVTIQALVADGLIGRELRALAGDVVQMGQLSIASEGDLMLSYPHLARLAGEARWGTLAAAPVALDEQSLSLLVLAFTAEQEFGPGDQALLMTIARQGAIALGRARLYEVEQQARAAAEAAVQLRDQFLSVASHELRTPLTSLLGNAELLQRRTIRDAELSERNQRSLQVIVDQADRLSQMINALLDLARMQSGQLVLELRQVDLEAVIRQVIEEAQSLLMNHTVLVDLPDAPVVILGDELRLALVIYNLVSNAAKYSSAGSHVVIRLRQSAQAASVEVTDQGIGIPAEALPHLFQRFFRASNVDPRRISGMGIGLFVLKEIVTLHGGTVSVESVEGRGSTFSVALPLAAPEPAAGGSEAGTAD